MQPIDANTLKPVPLHLIDTVRRLGDAPAYWHEVDGDWQSQSWSGFGAEVERAGRALIALGLDPGQVVCILGRNRPEWVVMAHAAMAAGCNPTGIYFTSSAEEIDYIIRHSDCPLVLCDTDENLSRVQSVRADVPGLRHVVSMNRQVAEADVLSWPDFLGLGGAEFQPELDARRNALTLKDTALLVYTSGTTGKPKAVVLSHRAAIWITQTLGEFMQVKDGARMLSYLPLAHIAEFNNSILGQAVFGSQVWYCLDPLTMRDVLPLCRPTVFLGVPRVWQKIEERITTGVAAAKGAKGAMARWALGVGQEVAQKRLGGQKPGFGLALQYRLADRLLLRRVRRALGLADCGTILSSAAPISVQTLQFFFGLGIDVYEGYGQSEACGPSTMNCASANRLGSVGKPLPGIEARVAEDGEVLVRGPNVFDGYLKDPESSSETLTEDGWLLTGDLGQIDEDGFVTITGRKKEILITTGGKNISPAAIENDLTDIPLVEHAMLLGDGRKFVAALLSISEDALAAFAKAEGLDNPTPLHPRVQEVVAAAIAQINPRYSRVNQVHEFRILDRPLSQDADELTPTLKMKRRVIEENHAALIDAIYANPPEQEPL